MKLRSALMNWDWRPLARTLVWCGAAGAAVRHYRVPLPDPAAVARELVLGWLLTFGLLTWLQLRLFLGVLWVLAKLDDWTYAAAEWIVRPVAGRASFTVNFIAALAVQLGIVFGAVGLWRAADGSRVVAPLDSAISSREAWRGTGLSARSRECGLGIRRGLPLRRHRGESKTRSP